MVAIVITGFFYRLLSSRDHFTCKCVNHSYHDRNKIVKSVYFFKDIISVSSTIYFCVPCGKKVNLTFDVTIINLD